MKRVAVGFLFVFCMVILFSAVVWAGEAKPIRILGLYPLSGGMKAFSEQITLGLKLAIEEANAQGGILGRKIELILEDHLMKPEVASSKAQKYLLDEKVDILVGAGSNVIKPLQDLAKQYNVLLVAFGHDDQETGKNFSYNSIRPTASNSMITRANVAYAAKYLKGRKYYILNQDYIYGRDSAATFKKELARQIPGSQIVGEDYHPLMSKDLSPFLTKVKMSGAEVLYTSDWGLDISVLVKQRHELGIKAVLLGASLADITVLRESPEAVLGGNSCATWFDTDPTKESVAFINSWKKLIKSNEFPIPTVFSAREYIGTKFLLEGIKKAGSTEAKTLTPALEGLHMKSITGEVFMRACDHQLILPMQCVTVDKKTPPYFGVPVTIPASVTMIDERDVDNPRCKR